MNNISKNTLLKSGAATEDFNLDYGNDGAKPEARLKSD